MERGGSLRRVAKNLTIHRASRRDSVGRFCRKRLLHTTPAQRREREAYVSSEDRKYSHRIFGCGGYLGQCSGVSSDWQSMNTDPLPETMVRCHLQAKQTDEAKRGNEAAIASRSLADSFEFLVSSFMPLRSHSRGHEALWAGGNRLVLHARPAPQRSH